jgi:hypothetical protein
VGIDDGLKHESSIHCDELISILRINASNEDIEELSKNLEDRGATS